MYYQAEMFCAPRAPKRGTTKSVLSNTGYNQIFVRAARAKMRLVLSSFVHSFALFLLVETKPRGIRCQDQHTSDLAVT